LAKLKIDVGLRLRQLEIERQRVRLSHPSCAGENLARRKKGEERAEYGRSELRLAFHQIILVATESGAGAVIDVVLDEGDAVGCAQIFQG
jgi:citrate lyase beta subunit